MAQLQPRTLSLSPTHHHPPHRDVTIPHSLCVFIEDYDLAADELFPYEEEEGQVCHSCSCSTLSLPHPPPPTSRHHPSLGVFRIQRRSTPYWVYSANCTALTALPLILPPACGTYP